MSREELSELRRFDQGLHLSHCCAEEHTEPVLQGDNLHHGCTTICRLCLRCVWDSIERLLAEERERLVFEHVPTIEEAIKEICRTLRPLDNDVDVQSPYLRARLKQLIGRAVRAEREKVREVCASAVQKRGKELRDLLKTIEESCGPSDVDTETERVRLENRADELDLVAAGIRQLDLTAPSSAEEGKGGDAK